MLGSKKSIKDPKKVFGFSDKRIEIGCGKILLLWLKCLASVVNGLRKCPKI